MALVRWLRGAVSTLRLRKPVMPSLARPKNISEARNWYPQHEWALEESTRTGRHTLPSKGKVNRFNRILKLLMPQLLDTTNVVIMTISGFALLSVGVLEAWLVTRPEARDIKFLLWYGYEQMLPSNVWVYKDESMICQALGRDPAETLVELGDTQEDARRALLISDSRTMRGIIAGIIVTSQVLRMVNHTLAASRIFRQRVLTGRERPLPNRVKGRVLRLCGRQSSVTELSVRRCKEHLFPIYDEPTNHFSATGHLSGVNELGWLNRLVNKFSDHGKIPVHWQVDPAEYGMAHTWDPLRIDSTFCLLDTQGTQILCIEADSTNLEDSLGIGNETNDFTATRAAMAFRAIVRSAEIRMGNDMCFQRVRPLRVFMGDLLEQMPTGGGHSFSVREHIQHDADVMIDSHAAILKRLLDWCTGVDLGYSETLDNPPVFEFHTDSRQYFLNLEAILREHKWAIHDIEPDNFARPRLAKAGPLPAKESMGPSHCVAKYQDSSQPTQGTDEHVEAENTHGHIVYYSTSERTVNAVHVLVHTLPEDHKMADHLVIVDSIDSYNHLSRLKHEKFKQFELLCCAEIQDNLFRQVRVWARLGYPYGEIQEEIDRRYRRSAETRAAALARLRQAAQASATVDVAGKGSRALLPSVLARKLRVARRRRGRLQRRKHNRCRHVGSGAEAGNGPEQPK